MHYLRIWTILSLNQFDFNKTSDFKAGYQQILSLENNDIEQDAEDIINEVCGLTLSLIVNNQEDQNGTQSLLNSYILNIEEYYGYFSAIKPFLCFYCNKTKSRKYGLLQHLKNMHAEEKDMSTNGNCVSHIGYIMLLKLFNMMNNRCLSHWNADDVLTKYVNRLRTTSAFFKIEKSSKNLNKLEQIEAIIKKTKEIILRRHNNDDDDDIKEVNDYDREMEEHASFYDLGYQTSNTSSPSFKYHVESEDVMDTQQKQKFDALPFETKRAMVTAHYIARILHSYFKRHHFCSESNEHYIHILDHVYITGGAVRNYLVGKNVNDLDLIVDVCTLQKIQSEHLHFFHELDNYKNTFAANNTNDDDEKSEYNNSNPQNDKLWDDHKSKDRQMPAISTDEDYHYLINQQYADYDDYLIRKQTHCKCLWHLQFYQKILKSYQSKKVWKMDPVQSEWIFNAKVLSRIIVNGMKEDFGANNKHALSVFIDKNNIIKILVKGHLVINGIDIHGQFVDIGDTSNHSFSSHAKYNKLPLQEYHQKDPSRYNFNNQFFYYSNAEMRWIQLLKPGSLKDFKFHYCNLREDVINRDFTVNSLLLPLSKILTKQQCIRWRKSDVIDYVGGLGDIELRKLAVAPQSTVKKILHTSPIRIIRAIKYCFEFEEFEIDQKLKEGMIAHADLLRNASCTHIQQLFASMVKACAESVEETERMLDLYEEFELTNLMTEIMLSDTSFLRHFLNVTSKLDKEIQAVYEKYEYPSIFNVDDRDLSRALKQKKLDIIDQNSSYRHLVQSVTIIGSLLKYFDNFE